MLISLLIISLASFTSIPQEFGGAKHRWVYLDVDTQQFNEVTLDYMGLNQQEKIASTDPILMLYSNSDFIVIKQPLDSKAITIKSRYVNSIREASELEVQFFKDSDTIQTNLMATCSLMQVPAGLSCDQFVYPPLKKPTTKVLAQPTHRTATQ